MLNEESRRSISNTLSFPVPSVPICGTCTQQEACHVSKGYLSCPHVFIMCSTVCLKSLGVTWLETLRKHCPTPVVSNLWLLQNDFRLLCRLLPYTVHLSAIALDYLGLWSFTHRKYNTILELNRQHELRFPSKQPPRRC